MRQLTLQPEPALKSRLAEPAPAPIERVRFAKNPEHTPRQDLIFLLHAAAEIEHSLLVEYLYAALSIKPGVAVPNGGGATTSDWQDAIMQIAKEEMGHLLSVQNILRYVGGPLHFERQHFPYRSQIYPFPFALQRFTKKSLAKYVFAEMPEKAPASVNLTDEEHEEIFRFAREDAGGARLNHVGELYLELKRRFGSFQERDFPSDTARWQGKFSDWQADTDDPHARPVLGITVYTVSSVLSAMDALDAIAIQGEGEPTGNGNTPANVEATHFKRFLNIYRAFPSNFDPSLPVASNPNTSDVPDRPPTGVDDAWEESKFRNSRITNPVTLLCAHLFNVRYRMLLTDLEHALTLPTGKLDGCCRPVADGTAGATDSPRGNLVDWAFEDMTALARLARLLNGLDLTDVITDGKAGPPFEMPYSLDLPDRPAERWLAHRGFLTATEALLADKQLANVPDPQRVLQKLRDALPKRKAQLAQLSSGGC